MDKIRLAIVGVGNCASSLLQGIAYYAGKDENNNTGLMYWDIGGYKPYDMQVVAAFDIDERKVGKDVAEAIFAPPNCTTVFCKNVPPTGTRVSMGRVLDGFAEHMRDYDEDKTFLLAKDNEPDKADVVKILTETKAEILLNYLPVGSEEATRFYATCLS